MRYRPESDNANSTVCPGAVYSLYRDRNRATLAAYLVGEKVQDHSPNVLINEPEICCVTCNIVRDKRARNAFVRRICIFSLPNVAIFENGNARGDFAYSRCGGGIIEITSFVSFRLRFLRACSSSLLLIALFLSSENVRAHLTPNANSAKKNAKEMCVFGVFCKSKLKLHLNIFTFLSVPEC